MKEIKNNIRYEKSKQYQDTWSKIKQTLGNDRSRFKLLQSSIEPTAYNWLTTIQLMEHDFHHNKATFSDSVHIYYDMPLNYLLSRCVCGQIFNAESALSCKKGGFITFRRYELQQNSYQNFVTMCNQKPFAGDIYHYNTSNTKEDVRVDVSARGFGVRRQLTFSDIKVCNPLAKCYNEKNLKVNLCNTFEREKKKLQSENH